MFHTSVEEDNCRKSVILGSEDGVINSQQIPIVYGKKTIFYEGLVPIFVQVLSKNHLASFHSSHNWL